MTEYFWEPWINCEGYKKFENKKYYNDTECINCPYKGKATINIKDIRTPLKLDKQGEYVIPYNSIINLCTKSDFFTEDADRFRSRVWDTIRKRQDSLFVIETRFIDRIKDNVPSDFYKMDNVMIYVALSCKSEEYKIRQLLGLNIKYKGISIRPLIQDINIEKYISTQDIIDIKISGEYKVSNARKLDEFDLYNLSLQCKKHNINMHIDYYSKINKLYTDMFDKNIIRVDDTLKLTGIDENSIAEITKKYVKRFEVKSEYNLEFILKQLKMKDNIEKINKLNREINNLKLK